MWNDKENVITESVKTYLDEREKTQRWINVGFVIVFIVYVLLAGWIAYVTAEVKAVNDVKKETIQELARKYNESLKKWNELDNGKTTNGTTSKK